MTTISDIDRLAEWMDDKAIAEAKECGCRVVLVTIEEIEE